MLFPPPGAPSIRIVLGLGRNKDSRSKSSNAGFVLIDCVGDGGGNGKRDTCSKSDGDAGGGDGDGGGDREKYSDDDDDNDDDDDDNGDNGGGGDGGGNSTRIQKLVQHLEEHPVIEGYCYIPLHVAILVHIFLTMKGALPTTLHELFCDLALCCIVREQETHEPEPDKCLPNFSSINDLPDDLKSKLSNLSTLAYNGIMQNKIVFYSKDLQKCHLPTDLPSLGLLQGVVGLTLCSKCLSYNFLKKS